MKKYLFKFTKPTPETVWWDHQGNTEVNRLCQYQLDVYNSILTGPDDRLIITYEDDGVTAYWGHECSIEHHQMIEDKYSTDEDLLLLRQLSNAYYAAQNTKIEIYEDDVLVTRLV